ncbi:MAG: XRE family transcriptional regulator [Bacteroidetes bacterium]|nr:MAG: XRE family transcriptional regulator [Bacteroidota bacterium]
MALHEQNIRLTFGLKLRQLRQEKGLSLQALSQRTGISVSYLNEIEKGKKYPKTNKIAALAEGLDVSYDWLVSLQLHPKLAPLTELLQSNLLQELPLDVLGIDRAKLIELLADAPAKLSAFVSTLIEISRNYDMQVEQFFFSVLRSYQEMHNNYFEDLEEVAADFSAQYLLERQADSHTLSSMLEEHFGISTRYEDFQPEALHALRSVYLPQKRLLLINRHLSKAQRRFVLARELGFAHLALSPRPYTFSWVTVSSFEEVLNNFKASYFAGALLLPAADLLPSIEKLFKGPEWQPAAWLALLERYVVTPETLLHRFTSLLPHFLGLQELFFLRFGTDTSSQEVRLTKEMHLGQLHNPHATALHEHYCRRWVSLQVLHAMQNQRQEGYLCDSQISDYIDSPNRYWVLTMARSMYPTPATLSSVSIGILLNEKSQQLIRFLENPQLPRRKVGETCERCSAHDCAERAAPPSVLEAKQQHQARLEALQELVRRYEQP